MVHNAHWKQQAKILLQRQTIDKQLIGAQPTQSHVRGAHKAGWGRWYKVFMYLWRLVTGCNRRLMLLNIGGFSRFPHCHFSHYSAMLTVAYWTAVLGEMLLWVWDRVCRSGMPNEGAMMAYKPSGLSVWTQCPASCKKYILCPRAAICSWSCKIK